MKKEIPPVSMKIRRSKERGHANHGWLTSYHTFSFADYFDAAHMSFRSLRVINEDWIDAAQGFGSHPHKDMEIITIVLEGELAHKDSMSNSSLIRPGDVQRMSAGTGVIHSEFNNSKNRKVHLYQIWILPATKGLSPSYEQKSFSKRKNQLILVASSKGDEGSITVHQDVKIYICQLEEDQAITYSVNNARGVWIQIEKGQLQVEGETLNEGDAVAIENISQINLQAKEESRFLLFDVL